MPRWFARFALIVPFLLLAIPALAAEPAADFFVSPRGNDQWSGRLADPKPDGGDGPLATLRRRRRSCGS